MFEPPSPTIAPARVGGRYVLLDEVGRGGMATVHRAHDEVLDRTVAVKLLHAHLARDATFLERFRREARAAAGLTHPNVVAVYDWGETPQGAFLVLQLVEGPTLRSVLQARGRLDAREAAGVLVPAARGLGAAHRLELVHRDVKPENLLLGDDGTVRITDFGLARAVASSSNTFGTDVLVGSPHYLAPEAVRGERLDPRADVYGLGIVLYECLTGRPPHEGDSPYATAMAHVAASVPPPSASVDDLDPALDEVVAWATAPDAAHRYHDALDFARALTNAVPDASGIDALVTSVEPATTVLRMPGGAPVQGDLANARADEASDGHTDAERDEPTSLLHERSRAGDEDDTDEQVAARPHRRRWRLLLAVLLLVGGSAAGGYLLWDRVVAPVLDVPAVIGATEQDAVAALSAAGFEATVADEPAHHAEIPVGHVVEQDPQGSARYGSRVLLVLSAGPRQIELVELFGQSEEAARQWLVDVGLDVDVTQSYDDEVPEGMVVAMRPEAGSVVDEGTTVGIVLSRGPPPVEVPDLDGLSLDEADQKLADAGLSLSVGERRESLAAENTVIGQSPEPGVELERGGTVEVVVSDGPPEVEVPSVRGENVSDATAQLDALGLVVDVERRGGIGAFLNPGRVFDQDPGPGAVRRAGETVTLFAYEG